MTLSLGSQGPVARLRPREPRNEKPPSGAPSPSQSLALHWTGQVRPGSEDSDTGWQNRRPRPSSESDSHSARRPRGRATRSAVEEQRTPARADSPRPRAGNSVAATARRAGWTGRACDVRWGNASPGRLGGAGRAHVTVGGSGWAGCFGPVRSELGKVYAGAGGWAGFGREGTPDMRPDRPRGRGPGSRAPHLAAGPLPAPSKSAKSCWGRVRANKL